MKAQPKSRTKKRAKPGLPDPLTGYAMDDLLWDSASPLATLIFEDLEGQAPAEPFWSTVSGAARYYASALEARTAKRLYEETAAPLLRRVREVDWRRRQKMATLDAMMLWSALLVQQAALHPKASDGQLWVLIRDALRALVQELSLVQADGH